MQTLAQILAGQTGDPYQNSGGGLNPLLAQFLYNQSLAPSQLGGVPAQGMPQQPQQQPPQNMAGFGSMGAPGAQPMPSGILPPSY